MTTLSRRLLLTASAAALFAGCARRPRFLTYTGPEVTEVVLWKAERRLELWHNDQMLRSYDVGLGQNPLGHKQYEGDSRTPEGLYEIDRQNPNSSYHLSLGISYPNEDDIARAAERGLPPGGDIFIHGQGPRHPFARGDWSAGCITVTDEEIEEIYSMVRLGTPIMIHP